MMNLRLLSGAALALLAGAPSAVLAQLNMPAVIPPAAMAVPPPVPVAAPAPAVAAPAPVAAGPTRNLWTFLCPTPAQLARCKAKFCGSQFGQLINNSLAPLSVFTGGVIGQPCPLIPAAGLAAPPDSALGAAAQIQKDTLEAQARRAAVRYLSTVDCNWWDQARDALINSLRADKNECVRMEAAFALQRGCCCNPPIIKALVNTLSVFPDDGNPPEDSPRVRAAAMGALEHCLSCYVAVAPVPPAPPLPPPPSPPKEGLPVPKEMLPPPKAPPSTLPPVPDSVTDAQSRIRPAAYRPQAPEQNMEQLVQHARRVLQQAKSQPRKPVPFAPGERSLLDVIENALHPPAPPPSAPKQSLQTSSNCCVPTPQIAANGGRTFAEPPALMPQQQLPPPRLIPQPSTIPAVSTSAPRAPVPAAPLAQAQIEVPASRSAVVGGATPPTPHAPAKVEENRLPSASLPKIISPAPGAQADAGVDRLSSPPLRAPTLPAPPAQAKVGESAGHPAPAGPSSSQAPVPAEVSANHPVPAGITPPPAPRAQADRGEGRLNSLPLPAPTPPAQVSLLPKPSMATSARPATRPSPGGKSSSADPVILNTKWSPSQPAPSLSKTSTKPAPLVAPAPPAVSSKTSPLNWEHETAAMMPAVPVVSTVASTNHREHEQGAIAAAALPAVSPPADSDASLSISQLVACLRSSPSPDKRMWAVQSLISCGETSPTVVQALMSGTATDTSDLVRFACLRGLLQLGITDPALLAKLDWPQIDGDLHVREAAWRLYLFGSEAPSDPRVREAAKELNQCLPSRPGIPMPGQS